MSALALAFVAAFAAFLIRGFSGFGSALVITPLLLVAYDVREVVALTAVLGVVLGSQIAWRARAAVDRAQLRLLFVVGLPSIVAGSLLLARAGDELLRTGFGALIVAFALRMLLVQLRTTGPRRSWPQAAGVAAGMLGGAMGGLFGTSGPPVVVYLENQLRSRTALRATLLAFLFAVDAVRLATYGLAGVLTAELVPLAAVAIPAAALGGWSGTRLHGRVNERVFRGWLALLLLASGLVLAIR